MGISMSASAWTPLVPDPSPSCYPWYAIRTRSNQEKVTAIALAGKGYDPYLPTYRVRRRLSDRVVVTELPLFPGYVFCRFDFFKRLPILTTPGVVSLVGFGSEPAIISDGEIEAVQTVLESGLNAGPHAFLREGQRIRVKRGALAGLEGILLKQKSDWRLVISVAMLQRSIAVEIDCDWVTPA
jgi:transcription antitermination factor NusG